MRLAIFAASLLSVAVSSAAADEFPLGRWYTEGTERDYYLQMVIENRADKTFIKNGAFVTDCKTIQPTTEGGTWTFDGQRYVEVTRTVNGQDVDSTDPNETDSFDITRIDADHVAMFDPKTGTTWKLARATDLTLPPPATCAS